MFSATLFVISVLFVVLLVGKVLAILKKQNRGIAFS